MTEADVVAVQFNPFRSSQFYKANLLNLWQAKRLPYNIFSVAPVRGTYLTLWWQPKRYPTVYR